MEEWSKSFTEAERDDLILIGKETILEENYVGYAFKMFMQHEAGRHTVEVFPPKSNDEVFSSEAEFIGARVEWENYPPKPLARNFQYLISDIMRLAYELRIGYELICKDIVTEKEVGIRHMPPLTKSMYKKNRSNRSSAQSPTYGHGSFDKTAQMRFDLKSDAQTVVSGFTPALLIDPFVTDSRNELDNLQKYFIEFSKACIGTVYVVIVDLFKDPDGKVKKLMEPLKKMVVSDIKIHIMLASELLFKNLKFPAVFIPEQLTDKPRKVYQHLRKLFDEKGGGFASVIHHWVKRKHLELEKSGVARTHAELTVYAFLESTMYLMLRIMKIPCTLHTTDIDSFLLFLENSPRVIDKKMHHFGWTKFLELFCQSDPRLNQLNQSSMVAYVNGRTAKLCYGSRNALIDVESRNNRM